jgi:[ribosomal protein S5]-alanine N-acetyltransferase
MITLTTARLLLRQLMPDDARQLYLLNSDPEVLRYTGDLPYTSIEEARTFILRYNQYSLYQCGRLAMIEKETGWFIGWCGLKYRVFEDETELGYRLKKEFWNRGFATEAALACIRYGFQELKRSCIIGRVLKANKASIRVLEKIGMTYLKDFEFDGQPGMYLKIENKTSASKVIL